MNIWSKHIKDTRREYKRPSGTNYGPADRVVFKDGAKLSVQARRHTYCSPREDNPAGGQWNSFECWCFEGLTREDLRALYPGGGVGDDALPAGWVSAETLDAIAARHGGLA